MNTELIDFYATDGVLNNGFIMSNNSKKILIATHGMDSNCFKKRERIIAETVLKNGIDFLGYNNRGSELVKDVKKKTENGVTKILGGTTFEDMTDSYYDIKGAILKVIELGYEEIYLQGHSLGSSKVVYTYNKLKEENSELIKHIKGIILLSLVDIPRALKIYLNKNFLNMLKLAEDKESKGEVYDIMPKESFIHLISVKTFLKYAKYNNDINFSCYHDEKFEFKELNSIDVPLFMRWGNVNEMIEQDAKQLVELVSSKINNSKKDINYIDGADHSYTGKEEVLANQIVKFLFNI